MKTKPPKRTKRLRPGSERDLLVLPDKLAPAPRPLPTLPKTAPALLGDLGLAQVRDLAIADLAGRLNAAPEAIIVRTLEDVDWPDASLGCPEPGFMYAQVITPGYRIILEAGGQTYAYHASRYAVKLCQQPTELSPEDEGQVEIADPRDLYNSRR